MLQSKLHEIRRFFKETYNVLVEENALYGLSIPMMGIRPIIICNDGFSMSVKGSQYTYCEPKITTDWYESLEIGFPSDEDELLKIITVVIMFMVMYLLI